MHPSTRAERRAQRDRIVSRRRFVWEHIWGARAWATNDRTNDVTSNNAGWHPEWGRYAKWNMNCGCTRCHYVKYYDIKSRRRNRRNASESVAECRNSDRKIS